MKKIERQEFINKLSSLDTANMWISDIANYIGYNGTLKSLRYFLINNKIPFLRRFSIGSGPERKTDYELFMAKINSLYSYPLPIKNQRDFLSSIKKYPSRYGIILDNNDICEILNVSKKTLESWTLDPNSKSYRVMDERLQKMLIYEIRHRVARLVSAKKLRDRYPTIQTHIE